MNRMASFTVYAIVCAGCGAHAETTPFEEDPTEIRLLDPGDVSDVRHWVDGGWQVTNTIALCLGCQIAGSPTAWPSTGPLWPIPAWTPVCAAPGCGTPGYALDEDDERCPVWVYSPEEAGTLDDCLAGSGWATVGRLLCPGCVGREAAGVVRCLEVAAEYAGMDPLW